MSLRAAALGDKLLARLDPQTPRTIDDLLPWWERHGVLRVELVRLLRHLVEEEQVEKGPDGYVLVTHGRKSSSARLEPVPAPTPPAAPAPPAPRVAPPPPPAPSGTRVVKEEPKKDEAKKEAPKKEEPKKDEPKKEERAERPAPRPAEPAPPPEVHEAPSATQEEAPMSTAPMSVGTGTLVSRVLDELAKQPRSCAELLKVFVDSNPNTVRGALARLKSSGRVLLDDQGIYHPAGR